MASPLAAHRALYTLAADHHPADDPASGHCSGRFHGASLAAPVTERLSSAVTRDIAAIIELLQTDEEEDDYQRVIRIAREKLGLSIYIEPKSDLPAPRPEPLFSILDTILANQLTQQIGRPFWIDTYGNGSLVEIRVQLEDKTLRVFTSRSAAYASNTHIFLVWMVGASLVLIAISILFLRGQIKPIEALAKAAENFGRGQKISAYSPRGADEVRRAGLAFILMRERIERQMEQRTAMLNGVSHDLRTILTRFKLQLALAGDNPDLEGLDKDVEDMQSMLEATSPLPAPMSRRMSARWSFRHFWKKSTMISSCTARNSATSFIISTRSSRARMPSPASSPILRRMPGAMPPSSISTSARRHAPSS